MTPDEVAQFYSWAASADSRLEELDQADLFAWSQILHEVPFADAGALFKRLFSVERKHKLQPGTDRPGKTSQQKVRASSIPRNAPGNRREAQPHSVTATRARHRPTRIQTARGTAASY